MFNFFNKKNILQNEKEYIYKPITDFKKIFDTLYLISGISDLNKRPIIKERLSKIAEKHRLETDEAFLNKFNLDKKFNQEVVDCITINETFFLREIKNLQWLINYINKRENNTKILSIPSSSGEEIYSILILIHQKNPTLLSKIEITGIDINQKSIDKALKGVYSGRSLYHINENLIQNYFTKENESYKISNFLQKKVTFIQENIFNLSKNKIGTFDIILCRNLFIYFDEEHRKKATDIIINLLNQNAILILGHADIIEDTQQKLIKKENCIYKKSTHLI